MQKLVLLTDNKSKVNEFLLNISRIVYTKRLTDTFSKKLCHNQK